jgi:trans-aconitate 2-methyltransferase
MDDASARAPRTRDWDAATYHHVSTPHAGWADVVLGRLELRGDETVLDLGTGTGKVAAKLLERLPEGRVVGVDGSAAMIEEARRRLGDDPRVSLMCSDLLALSVDPPADAAVSSATFHWIADHDALFARVRAALKPGAQFVAQCGGRGNIASVVRAARDVMAQEPFAPHFAGWAGPWNYAGVEETTERLARAGFQVVDVWLTEAPVVPDDPRGFLRAVTLGSHLERLPDRLRDPFVDAVRAAHGDPAVHDYVRLNFVAHAR